MNEPRKKLSDILHAGADRENLSRLWETTAAAEERGPLPPGEYTFRIIAGDLFTAKKGTPGYKLTLEVAEGDLEGRRAWCDFWLTPAALPMTKRDLAKIGLTDLRQLEQPLPPGILIRGKVILRRDDDGNESNRLVRFECIGTEPADAYEPPADDQGDGEPPDASGRPTPHEGHERQAGELFPFGGNADGEADQRDKDFLRREKGGRP
jgi:hypothetical protein